MRPRFFVAAQDELDHVGQALQTVVASRHKPWTPSFGLGLLMAFFGFMVLWLTWPRTPSADPLADARLNNAPGTTLAMPTPVQTPAPRAELVKANPNVPRATLVGLGTPVAGHYFVNYGDSFWLKMPDGRWIVATAMGQADSVLDFPLTNNRIGDARWTGKTCWVWLRPFGQVNPTWIDP